MPDGLNLNLEELGLQLKERLESSGANLPGWSFLGEKAPLRQQEMPSVFPGSDLLQQKQQTAPRPEQMLGTQRADERTVREVQALLADAQRQSYRSEEAKRYSHAVQIADNSRDASLQALSKVEYGLAHLRWGYPEQGFKWILEAGSNNPSIYDRTSNQSFLKRLAQAGIPQSAVDMLIRNGQQDPNWHLNDANAARKLDQAMSGPAFVPPMEANPQGVRPGQQNLDPLAPPVERRPENYNPQLDPPAQAGAWMIQQVNDSLRSAMQQKDTNQAFALYKQAVSLADRSRDPSLQATARVETGLALISWGETENGFKWLLDAGAKNKSLYDQRVNGSYIERLEKFGLPKDAISALLQNGHQDPNWHLKDPDAAKNLAQLTRKPQAPPAPPLDRQIENPPYKNPLPPEIQTPSILPLPWEQNTKPQPQSDPQKRRPSPFG